MASGRSSQDKNTVLGDQANRDINKTYNYGADSATPMRRLIERLKEERRNDTQFHETLEILRRYTEPPSGDSVQGLEEKLLAADRKDLLAFATQAKEIFAKKLYENQFSECGQEILGLLLAEVYTRFHLHVVPAIRAGRPPDEITRLAQTMVIDKVSALLEENPLRLYADDINGMVFYLTGNCHLRWSN